MKVIVSQPNKQYCNDLLIALHQKAYLEKFYTLLSAKKVAGVAKLLPSNFKGEMRKRTFKGIPATKIHHFPGLLLYHKLMTGDIESKVKKSFRIFDQNVAKSLKTTDYDIALSYENANLLTFQQAKTDGKPTVLDLAQVHHHTIRAINNIVSLEKGLTNEKLDFIDDLKQQALEVTDYILTLSSFAKDTLTEHGIADDRIYTVNLGINPAVFKCKTQWNTNEKMLFLFVGTMTYRKGVDILLKAFKELNLPNAELILVGPMADAKDVMEQYEDVCTYIPFLHHEALKEYYQKADVFVFPSYLDSWAQTVVEAMACGTPCIVSEHTGAKDAVKQGGGFIIPINDMDALKEKVLYFVEHPEQTEILGRKAHEIAQQYTWANYHNQVVTAVEDIARKEGIK